MRTIAPRAFNTLTVDPIRGTITKKSKNVDKFIDEINYVAHLPSDISSFFPRVIDSSVDPANPFVTMEYYGYPTLAELYVHDSKDVDTWSSIFTHLHSVLVNHFSTHSADVTYKSVHNMYLGKLHERLETMKRDATLREIVNARFVVVNGRKIENLPSLWESLEYEVDRLANNVSGSIVHGDFCFSNILYDVDAHVCRFIDPRGSFGGDTPGINGDLRYDVAKLWHSIDGMYDFITADKFSINVRPNANIDLAICAGAEELRVADTFADIFFSTWNRRDIEIICGLMLCSIPALHYDYPDRQVAMYVRGLQLLNDGLNS